MRTQAFLFTAFIVRTQAFNFQFPWDSSKAPKLDFLGGPSGDPALQPSDTVAVIGASGNVGKLVALRLADTYQVNCVLRDSSKVADFLNKDSIQLFEINLVEQMKDSTVGTAATKASYPPALRSALEKANAIVICTGTTAFPTKAWTKSGESEVAGDVLNALVENSFNVKKTISSLDAKGLNTPSNVDARANQFILDAWKDLCKVQRKRCIMLSSIGVQRRDQMPFPVLNACGVLDAKAKGEDAIQKAAEEGGFSYTIIRPGQLFGGPYDNNYYLGTLFQLDKDAKTQDVEVGLGDTLLGDTLRSTLAEVTAQVCEANLGLNMDFAVVNVKGNSPSNEEVQERLRQLV